MMTLDRNVILAALKSALEPLPYVYAMWEGGAAAFNRLDEWSDIDLQVDADDGQAGRVIAAAEAALRPLSDVALRYELPQPTWHGHAQVFYQLAQASPFLLLDFVVIRHSAPEKFLQPEIHGAAVVHFDKAGLVVSPAFNRTAHRARLRARLETLRVTFPMFQTLTLKEIFRRNAIEAMAFYNAYTLRPLVEILRMQHCPDRFDFASRYVYYDLPPDVVRRLEPLFFVGSLEDLPARRQQAEILFNTALAVMDRQPG
jgi:hypothetical protein